MRRRAIALGALAILGAVALVTALCAANRVRAGAVHDSGARRALAGGPAPLAGQRAGAALAPFVAPAAADLGGPRLSGRVEDASGGVVVGASVAALAVDRASRVLGLAIADDAGRFQIAVPPGVVRILARADGYASAWSETVAPAEDLRLVLAPGATLTGRVVVKGTDAAVAGVSVTAAQDGGGFTEATATTDARGAFELRGLRPGGYNLLALSPRWRSVPRRAAAGVGQGAPPITLEVFPAASVAGTITVAERPCANGSIELDGPVSARAATSAAEPRDGAVGADGIIPGHYRLAVHCEGALSLTEEIDVAATAAEPPKRLWRLASGRTVSGTVVAASGAPAAGVTVTVVPVTAAPGQGGVECVSDAAARFACGGVPAGAHDCFASGEHGPIGGRVGVQVAGSADPAPVTLRLSGAGSIRVTVAAAEGGPADHAEVVAWRDADEVATGHRVGLGTFLIRDLALGRYEVAAGRDPESRRAAAAATLDRDGAVVELRLAAPRAAAIAGRVVDARGLPVADAWVRAESPLRPLMHLDATHAPSMTGDDGRFSLTGLAPGSYNVRATGEMGEGLAEDVVAGGAVEIRVHAWGTISGVARNVGGSPVTSFVLTHAGDGGVTRTQRVYDPAGAFDLPWLAPGPWSVEARDDGGRAAALAVNLAAGQRQQVVLTLVPRSEASSGNEPGDPVRPTGGR